MGGSLGFEALDKKRKRILNKLINNNFISIDFLEIYKRVRKSSVPELTVNIFLLQINYDSYKLHNRLQTTYT